MKRSIKVVKSAERERARTRGKNVPVKEAAKDPARDIVRTVSDWVRESKRKRNGNPKLAFEDLFGG
jgi:hypothetical protein